MTLIRQKAERSGATINDVLMTAYARVIARLQNTSAVVLPCPADLRRFHPAPCAYTVANMTGTYRRIAIELPPNSSFADTLQKVHLEMTLQKSRRRCFAGVKALRKAVSVLPRALLELVIRATYRPPPVSYANMGAIQHEKLHFQGCTIQDCFLTGTYRHPPDFQLTASTFQNICTLNCALIGSTADAQTGQDILEQVKGELLMWIIPHKQAHLENTENRPAINRSHDRTGPATK